MGVISRTMGCSPTKADQKGDHHDKHDDVYLQPDLDIEAYHFHHYVRDLISNKDFKTEQGLGVQVFLNTLFMNWPIPDPKVYKVLKRYGSNYETWPQTHTELLDTIDRTEKCLIDTILGDKLRPVSAYLKGAATMKELIHDSEAKPDEITWPDAQHIFREMLKQLKGPDDAILLNWEDVPMHDKNHVDVCAEERLCWSDFQVLFNEELGSDAIHVFMLENAGDKFKTNLTLKIPEEKIDECLKGEYRMYCKNIEQNNSFSYGLIIDSVTEAGCEPNGFGTEKKSFTFTGKPRLGGKYVLENGTATWNEQGSGRFNLKYDEHWPDGMVDKLQARLKCNGKFACDSTAGFVQKARKESTLPVSAKQRMESKYYIGDQDAASD